MFDLGWSEMAVIMLVALVVIGPKDLPRMARTIGQWVAKGRSMAREFQRSLEEMAREAELDDVKREIEKVGRTDIGKSIEKTIDPSGELKKAFDPRADEKGAKAAQGASAANGQAAEPALPKAAEQGEAGKAASSEASAATTEPTKPKAAAKSRTSNAAKTSAKPKAPAKPRSTTSKATAKPKATASRARATGGRKAAAPRSAGAKSSAGAAKTPTETVKPETVAEPS